MPVIIENPLDIENNAPICDIDRQSITNAVAGSELPRRGRRTGRGAAWLARLTGGQKVAGSNPVAPILTT